MSHIPRAKKPKAFNLGSDVLVRPPTGGGHGNQATKPKANGPRGPKTSGNMDHFSNNLAKSALTLGKRINMLFHLPEMLANHSGTFGHMRRSLANKPGTWSKILGMLFKSPRILGNIPATLFHFRGK